VSDTRSDLSLPKQEAGLLFRAEMATTSFFLGYWKHLATVIVLGLLGILIYGQYDANWRRHQRAMTAQTSEEWAKLPAQAIPGQLTDDQKTTMQSVADALVKDAAGFSGPAAAEAHLKAAELYRILGKPDQQKAALEGAVPHAKGPLYYAARSSLANLATEQGDNETAVKIYKDLMDEMDGYLAQQAALNLGMTYEAMDRDADARSVYVQFQGKWPNSPIAQQIQARIAHLDATQPEGVAAPEAPTDHGAPAPAPAPADDAKAPE